MVEIIAQPWFFPTCGAVLAVTAVVLTAYVAVEMDKKREKMDSERARMDKKIAYIAQQYHVARELSTHIKVLEYSVQVLHSTQPVSPAFSAALIEPIVDRISQKFAYLHTAANEEWTPDQLQHHLNGVRQIAQHAIAGISQQSNNWLIWKTNIVVPIRN
jgi:hypothetical protein